MNRVALWILAIFVVLAAIVYYSTYGFLGVKLAKTDSVPPHSEPGVDREGMYQSGVLLLSGLAAAVAIGMSIPFYLSLAHRPSKVVEEPLYFQVVVWFFLPIMVLMGVAPFVGWRRASWKDIGNKLVNILAVTFGTLGLSLMAVKAAPPSVQTPAGSTIVFPKILVTPGGWIVLGLALVATVYFVARAKATLSRSKRVNLAVSLYVCLALAFVVLAADAALRVLHPHGGPTPDYLFNYAPPLVPWVIILVSVCLFCFIANGWRVIETYKRAKMSIGGFVAHMGVAILLAGLIISRGLQKEDQVQLQEGDEVTSMGYTISYQGFTDTNEGGAFDRNNKVKFMVSGPNGAFEARPGMYMIPQKDGTLQTMVWPHVEHMGTHDLYFALGQPQNDVWEQPESFAPGETRAPSIKDNQPGPISLTYKGFKMSGKGGGVGTTFVADVIIRITNMDGTISEHEVKPTIAITADGMQRAPAAIDDNFTVTMEGINAADRSGEFQIHLNRTIYYLDIFYKPMVILVWIGAAVTFLGGVFAAYSRRSRAKTPPSDREVA
jgi:cytochrome c biogenesis factor